MVRARAVRERPAVISDLRELPPEKVFDCDVCIVGGGVAGITIASQFIGRRSRVLLLEGGGLTLEPWSQELYSLENRGQVPVLGTTSRLRMFGGSSNHWTGRCAPLDALDFAARDWVPHSGWPIDLAELEPFYRRAQSVCDLGDYSYDRSALEVLKVPETRLDERTFVPMLWQYSAPTHFAAKFGAALRVVDNVHVVTHANACKLALRPDGAALDHVEIATPDGSRRRVTAKMFVLAAGGIENARLLLHSNDVQKAGIGNQRDLVGRFFMQHIRVESVLAMEGDPYLVSRIFRWGEASTHGKYVVGARASPQLQKAARILNGSALTYSETEGDAESGGNSLRHVSDALRSGEWPAHVGKELFNVVDDFSDAVLNIRGRFLTPEAEPYTRAMRRITVECEQAPNPASRITLSDSKDALGMQRAAADWRLTELDQLSTQQMFLTLGAEMARLYKARIAVPHWMAGSANDWTRSLIDVAHHIGTTRMSATEQTGVVDRNCCVFGVPNLFIAGSSVFPTGGQANPTLTIVALALRLADQLRSTIQ
jgi:choline dehydrogenase-like flavoprotein